MRIAVASQDGRTIATHGGRCRLFLLFDVEIGAGAGTVGAPVPAGRLELSEEMELHRHGDGGPHPIDGAAVVITGTSGQGFLNHMRRRGIEAVVTGETDPLTAIADWAAGRVKPAEAPHHPHEHHG